MNSSASSEEENRDTDMLPFNTTINMPEKNSENKTQKSIYAILFFILSFIPIILFIQYEYNYFNKKIIFIAPPVFEKENISDTFIQENFINRCKLWISTDKDRILSILKREECIWAKLWKSVSYLNQSDICSVISIVFPTVTKNGFDTFPNYFYSLAQSDTFDPEFFEKEKKLDWPDETYKRMMPNGWKNDRKRFLMGQKYIQHEIWKRQHPSSCDNVNFCLINPRRTGFGSAIHTYAAITGYCMEQPNTVFTYSPYEKEPWTNGPFCGNENSMNCFFEPLTSCPLPSDPDELKRRSINRTKYDPFIFPLFVKDILKKSLIPEEYHHWYFTLSVTMYLMRLNKKTLDWLDSFEKEKLINPKNVYDVGIHVRHGDKGSEMLLVKAKNYMPAVDIIQKVTGKKRQDINLFVSTEDPQVISWFVNYSGCSVSYIDYLRTNPGRKHLLRGGAQLTLISLANLRLSLRTSVRVDTFGSNWDRLIIEMMYTFAERADSLVFEMGIMRSLSAEHYELLKRWKLAKNRQYLPKKRDIYEPDDP